LIFSNQTESITITKSLLGSTTAWFQQFPLNWVLKEMDLVEYKKGQCTNGG